ncbi:uncharacterized protein LOC114916965 [Cajanus cajan]|uniref:uncharacterized protein LOC114916965 n=1 Tax=Cajanus cajan TaxID=3821 RepID=UPI0010FB2160|nr:uncharacterized protein LOC114916965 [Cajanus cajan]
MNLKFALSTCAPFTLFSLGSSPTHSPKTVNTTFLHSIPKTRTDCEEIATCDCKKVHLFTAHSSRRTLLKFAFLLSIAAPVVACFVSRSFIPFIQVILKLFERKTNFFIHLWCLLERTREGSLSLCSVLCTSPHLE